MGGKQRKEPRLRSEDLKDIPREQTAHFENRVTLFLRKAGGRAVPGADLKAKCRGKGQKAYLAALENLTREGVIANVGGGYVLSEGRGFFKGILARQQKSCGFARRTDTGEEVFIAGRDMSGALRGDVLLLTGAGEHEGMPGAAVVAVLKPADPQISGTLVDKDGETRFLPDTLCSKTLRVENARDWRGHTGEKVLARVTKRGRRHFDHVVRVEVSSGNAESARACADAFAAASGAPVEFSDECLAEADAAAKRGIRSEDYDGRLDFRGRAVFTIDGADAKDLDDAVSIERTENGYFLGVHIADVSHYVTMDSAPDLCARERGTSIYYADRVIPMLPKALSNGICSLTAGEDRLTFSALLRLDERGELTRFEFRKSVIRSAVRGVYSEVNALLEGRADDSIRQKYSAVLPSITLLSELLEKRLAARKERGALSIDAPESEFALNDAGVCEGISLRKRGAAEQLIEECMLLANEAAARRARTLNLPFVYRVHAAPPKDKVIRLCAVLDSLALPHPELQGAGPKAFEEVLRNAEKTKYSAAVNQMVLRSMAKADYETEPAGHFGLALRDYAHFTSPIRRYPDLSIHRLLSDESMTKEERAAFAKEAALRGSVTEQRAVSLERVCDDFYRAEWAKAHLGEVFEGTVSGCAEYGVYVALDNSAEGLLPMSELPPDAYEYDGFFSLRGAKNVFAPGDRLIVRIARADVCSGQVDFSLCEEDGG